MTFEIHRILAFELPDLFGAIHGYFLSYDRAYIDYKAE